MNFEYYLVREGYPVLGIADSASTPLTYWGYSSPLMIERLPHHRRWYQPPCLRVGDRFFVIKDRTFERLHSIHWDSGQYVYLGRDRAYRSREVIGVCT